MRTILTVALAIAFSPDRRHRWRQISVVGAALMATFAGCLFLALPPTAQDAYDLGSARGPDFSPPPPPGTHHAPEGSVAIVVFRAAIVDGEQVPTIWIEPLPGHEDDPAAVPVGLSRLPAPGAAVLSPGLVNAGHTARDFGWAPSSSGDNPDGSIGDRGLMTASEPLIFVRPAEGRSLAASSVAQYVQGFGVPPSQDSVAYATDPEFLTPRQLTIGGTGFVMIPAIALLVSGARARSRLREDRMRFLVTLGIAEWRVRALIACETGALAAVGGMAGAGLWWIASSVLTMIPMTGVSVRAGGFHTPWWWACVMLVAVVIVAAAVGSLGNLHPAWRRRPRRGLALAATIAMLGSGVLLVLAASRGIPFGDPLAPNTGIVVLGVFGILIFTPLAMPQIITWAGQILRRLQSPTLWATGRRMMAEPQQLSRIASVLSVLVILVSSGTALGLGSVRAEPDVDGPAQLSAASVSWVDAHEHDIDQVTEILHAENNPLLVLPIVETKDVEGEGAARPRLLLRDCPASLRFIGVKDEVSCDSAEGVDLLENALGADLVTEEDRKGRVATNAVAIFSRGTMDIGVIQKDLGALAGLNIGHRSDATPAPLPIHRWISAALVAVLILLGTAALREIGDRSIDDAERDEHFARIGLSDQATRCLAWAGLLIPMVVSVVLSATWSTIIAYAGQSIELMRQDPFKLLVICISSFLVTLLAIAASFPARRATRR